jgi:hypothetical protein
MQGSELSPVILEHLYLLGALCAILVPHSCVQFETMARVSLAMDFVRKKLTSRHVHK